MTEPQVSLLACGRRLHLHHGPIDLVIEAFGHPVDIHRSYTQACHAFQSVLIDLVQELGDLRSCDVQTYRHARGAGFCNAYGGCCRSGCGSYLERHD